MYCVFEKLIQPAAGFPVRTSPVHDYYDNATCQTTHYNFGTANPFERAIEFFCKNIEAGTQGSQDITIGYDVTFMPITLPISVEFKHTVKTPGRNLRKLNSMAQTPYDICVELHQVERAVTTQQPAVFNDHLDTITFAKRQ